ncbi:hypothetical protein EYF80_028024 [Liparis tanakae]|uniref:Uncharacterized protein n=1 Tax=Liparis tanakae TaxID=230148 RepID=A0A4Z2HAI9_9TELE|nr:hypothetical protein EYF80_028024 [Liparis tanakae]
MIQPVGEHDDIMIQPVVDLLPDHGAPHAEEAPQVADAAAVEGVLVGAAVLQVGDAVAGHELPGGGVQGHQVQVGAQQQQHHQRQQQQHHQHGQQHAVGPQPRRPAGGGAQAGPGGTREALKPTRPDPTRPDRRYSPGDVQPPQQHQQLHRQVQQEPAVVPLAHAVLDPGAVVVVAPHAAPAPYRLPRDTREATWTDLKVNQAYDKTEPSKDVNHIYKTNIDGGDLYGPDDPGSKNPVAEEMQRKLNVESERLRIRLRQELSELRERLSSSPAQLAVALAGMRERLAPLTRQLQSSLSSGTRDLCGQLSLYLRGPETAEARSNPASSLNQGAAYRMSQSLERGAAKVSVLISDFHAQTVGEMERLKEVGADHWQRIILRLGQEVSALRTEAQMRTGSLQAELAALIGPGEAEVAEVTAAGAERFCQNAAAQSHFFQGRMERLFQGLEEELEVPGASSLAPVSSSSSLQEDFSEKLSALIRDIMHSVQ